MEKIASYIQDLDFSSYWKIALVLLVGTLLVSAIGCFIFGKRSELNHAVSSAIGIIFIYAATVVLRSAGAWFEQFVAPLPYVDFTAGEMTLFTFAGTPFTTICSEVLSMIILAFLVNLADTLLPVGKNLFTWLFFRFATVVIAYVLHLIVVSLFATYMPAVVVTYAPVILLGILIILLLTGALKILIGALLTTVNPVIGALYTFFFASLVGKQISKAVLTTAILSGLIVGLHYLGITAVSIAASALVAYIPFLLVLLVLWYFVILIF